MLRTTDRKVRDSDVLAKLRPGQKIAITAGSRGITTLPQMLKTLVPRSSGLGGEPFMFPAMGSHGGATAEGQSDMLVGIGITEEHRARSARPWKPWRSGPRKTGCPCTWTTTPEADGIVVINRIKPHVAFRGPYESGLMKMLVIGLGKQNGAEICHNLGFGEDGGEHPVHGA